MTIIGKNIFRYDEIDSTSDEARRLIAAGAGEGLVVVAVKQSRGKGKPGSAWFSPPGNLYLSVVIEPHRNPGELAPITLLAALAVRSVIDKSTGLPVVIKWPNDLLIRGKKVGGILVERLLSGKMIVGIGLNVNTGKAVFPEELVQTATSLKIESGKKHSLVNITDQLIATLDARYLEYLQRI